VDSASNYIEEEQQLEDDEEGPPPDGPSPMSYADAVKHPGGPSADHVGGQCQWQIYLRKIQIFLYDGYAFGKKKLTEAPPALNAETGLSKKYNDTFRFHSVAFTVSTLQYPFEPVNIPPGIDQAEYREAFAQAQVYLVGTAHFSKESCEDVKRTVQAAQPDFVMVGLGRDRQK
jgi:hypothetical protein